MTLRAIGFAGALAACGGSGLSSGAWTWCKEHPLEVDTAASTLQLPTAATTVREPTWWQDYIISMQNSSIALVGANADFVASCDRAADAAGVGASRVNWCLTDGVGPAWTAAVSLNLVTEAEVETFRYRGISLEDRINNAEFVQACNSAYAGRTS
jgi:hypothetical protein